MKFLNSIAATLSAAHGRKNTACSLEMASDTVQYLNFFRQYRISMLQRNIEMNCRSRFDISHSRRMRACMLLAEIGALDKSRIRAASCWKRGVPAHRATIDD